ncbi:hypothetical protein [Actinomadura coerulea]|uniref:hypothetical protein n=1 Tax=Actinomadura coerulea TaxID=46159 RepID=UPI00343963B1
MAGDVPALTHAWGSQVAVLGFGVDVGFTGKLGEMYTGVEIMVYVLALTVMPQAAAFLTLGLVRPWGQTQPRWLPFLGGRRLPPLAATIPAALGGTAAAVLTSP